MLSAAGDAPAVKPPRLVTLAAALAILALLAWGLWTAAYRWHCGCWPPPFGPGCEQLCFDGA